MITLEQVESVLKSTKVDATTIAQVVARLGDLEDENKPEPGAPKAKSEFVILVRGDAALRDTLQQGWVAQVPQEDDASTLESRMKEAAYAHNNSIRKQGLRVVSWANLFARIKRKFSKDARFQVKTKEPARVLVLTEESI